MTDRRSASLNESDFIPYEAQRLMPSGAVLVLAPHADDEALGCGGAILRHLANGDRVQVVIVTDSDYGSFPEQVDGRAARRAESLCAAAHLGYGTPMFWGLPDRGVRYDEALVERVVAAVREHGVQTLYAPSWWEVHPDHQNLALAAVEAARRLNGTVRLLMYEVGVPLFPNLLLDISDIVGHKRRAIACYRSQLALQPYDQQITALNRFRTYTLARGITAAEAFHQLDGASLFEQPLGPASVSRYYAQARYSGPTSDQPLVTVVVLCRNPAARLEAVDSALLQTYTAVEVLVVATQDQDPEALLPPGAAVLPTVVRTLGTPSDACWPERVNRGIASAKGDFVVLLDDGDLLDPGQLAAQIRCLSDVEGSQAVEAAGPYPGGDADAFGPTETQTPQPTSGGDACDPVSFAGLLFARSLFEQGCRFDPTLSATEAKRVFLGRLSELTRIQRCLGVSAWRRNVTGIAPAPSALTTA